VITINSCWEEIERREIQKKKHLVDQGLKSEMLNTQMVRKFQRRRIRNYLQNHVVASLTPPLLRTCENLLVLLLFLERFQDYQNLGGTISLFHCAYDVKKKWIEF
jgi:hypothetical protein